MTRFLIKSDKNYGGRCEIWITYPWWDLLNRNVLLIIIDGTIEKCLKRIYWYAKNNYIDKYKVTVKRY